MHDLEAGTIVTGAKVYVQLPTPDGIINYGPWDTIPAAKEAAERVRRQWNRMTHKTPPGMPAIMIVKVVEAIYMEAQR